MIKEDLIQYIWKMQYYSNIGLKTVEGETIKVMRTGLLNTNQGPDFLDAQVKIGDTVWAGNLEVHIKTSDWVVHKHSADSHYDNVILHVVWQHDKDINLSFPTLELQNLVSVFLLEKYKILMQNKVKIPCYNFAIKIHELSLSIWKEKLLLQRLQQKGKAIELNLTRSQRDIEEVLWQAVARSFGVFLNTDLFETMAKALPLKIISRHRNSFLQIEALLFGQAGLLNEDFTDQYPQMLQKEYLFLMQKYGLTVNPFKASYLRMRPANFPTIRLAQLSALLFLQPNLFGKIKDAETIEELQNLLTVTANDYWHYHYVPDVVTPFKIKSLGSQMKNSIIINAFIPVLCIHAISTADEILLDKVITWLRQLPPEDNTITQLFKSMGIENKNAADSQALIQLKSKYCEARRCLECSIGNAILKN